MFKFKYKKKYFKIERPLPQPLSFIFCFIFSLHVQTSLPNLNVKPKMRLRFGMDQEPTTGSVPECFKIHSMPNRQCRRDQYDLKAKKKTKIHIFTPSFYLEPKDLYASHGFNFALIFNFFYLVFFIIFLLAWKETKISF